MSKCICCDNETILNDCNCCEKCVKAEEWYQMDMTDQFEEFYKLKQEVVILQAERDVLNQALELAAEESLYFNHQHNEASILKLYKTLNGAVMSYKDDYIQDAKKIRGVKNELV